MDLYDELESQYNDTTSALWTSYLTKTMNSEPILVSSILPDCFTHPSLSPSLSPTKSPLMVPPPTSLLDLFTCTIEVIEEFLNDILALFRNN